MSIENNDLPYMMSLYDYLGKAAGPEFRTQART